MQKKGVLLINLGTPDDYAPRAVYRYLTQFLNDPRVVDLPFIFRVFLVNAIIVPCRFKKSAAAYQEIWTEEGSPLLVNSVALSKSVANELGDEYQVVLGMRYGKPSIAAALEQLRDVQDIRVIPLFPQYSSAATGSAIEAVFSELSKRLTIPTLHIESQFYADAAFIAANAAIIRDYLKPDTTLIFSYHGLPERQLSQMNAHYNYRTQCYETSELIAKALGLSNYHIAFQSRLGRLQWIKPYFDELLPELAQGNQKNIAIACPSFVVDCLETLEEINIRAREQWTALGGKEFTFIPCVNNHPIWVKGLVDRIKQQI
jgi:protoporphyrin/coproporphyrin ferrochelatase